MNVKDWVYIDLHMHTKEGITRDGTRDSVTFTYTLFVETLIKYRLDLIAITNHNKIYLPNYYVSKYLASKLNVNTLLGVEIDTKTTDLDLHALIIFNDDIHQSIVVSKNINEKTKLFKNTNNNVIYEYKDILEAIRNSDALMIPHGVKPRGYMDNPTRENIEMALKHIEEGFFRIFDSPSDWKLEKIKEFIKVDLSEVDTTVFGGVLFSDIRDWTNYKNRYKKFLMNATPTYKGLLHSITNPTKRFTIEQELTKNSQYISEIKIEESNNMKESIIRLDRSFNVIIGKSGSGKSLLAHLIKKNLFHEYENQNKYSSFDDVNVTFLKGDDDEEATSTNINVSEGVNFYEQIISSHKGTDSEEMYSLIELLDKSFIKREKFKESIEEYKERINDYVKKVKEKEELKTDLNKYYIQLFDVMAKELKDLAKDEIFPVKTIALSKTTYNNDNIEKMKEYDTHIKALRELLKVYKGNNNIKDKVLRLIKSLESKFKKLVLEIELINLKEIFQNKKEESINKVINEINTSISKRAQKKSELIQKSNETKESIIKDQIRYYILKKQIPIIDLSIKNDYFDTTKIINEHHEIKVKEFIPAKIIKNMSDRENEMFITHGYKELIGKEKIYNLTNKKEAKELIDSYIDLGVITLEKPWLKQSFDVSVKIYFGENDVTKLNPGDIAKTYLEVYFETQIKKKENNVIIFDQIENNVDKDFIYTVIIKLIESTKRQLQTIIITHDPIVAVNADPIMYIEASKDMDKDNKAKISYRSFYPESDERDELETIANIVDGSKSVIKKRYRIYEGE